MISDNEHIEIFDFYSTTSYNFGIYVLDYGINDTTPPKGFVLVIETYLTRTSL